MARARNAGVSMTPDAQLQLEAYMRLLGRWNVKINLTALPLRRPTDETFDRLLIEPFAAARFTAVAAPNWFDIGSGGGSPAIPLKIAHPQAKLTMIESRSRKAAFLREAVRVLGLADVRVENERFEQVARRTEPQSLDMITVRAVRRDRSLLADIHRVISPTGRVFLFRSPEGKLGAVSDFTIVATATLGTSGEARLSILTPVFHVEQQSG